jgi:hypothetical protein
MFVGDFAFDLRPTYIRNLLSLYFELVHALERPTNYLRLGYFPSSITLLFVAD